MLERAMTTNEEITREPVLEKKPPMMFVKSSVKDVIKANGCKTSKELLVDEPDNPLNEMVRIALIKACKRARQNGRTIVFPRDV